MTEKPEEIYIREEDDVQFILGSPPGWILRWGISIAFGTVLIGLWASWIIRYPDVIVAPVNIVADRPVVRLVSVAGGRIAALPAKEKKRVMPDEVLAVIETPANWQHILSLERYLAQMPADSIYINHWLSQIVDAGIASTWILGSLQSDFNQWMTTHQQLRQAIQASDEAAQVSRLEHQLRDESRQLYGAIQAWKQTWLIVAPDTGIITLTSEWVPGQYVAPGQEIMTLVAPHQPGRVKAVGLLPAAGAGKVSVGMPVRIHLAGFPYREFGAIPGRVKDISLTPVNTGANTPSYRIEIELPQGLKTDYNRELPLLHESLGSARIITEKRNLFQRIFLPMYKTDKNHE